jgi:hypothetical protein
VVVVVAAIGGCGSSRGARGEPVEISTSTPAHLATGVIQPPPLTPRYALSVVPVGRYVVALGGYTLEGDHQFAAGGGAVFDRAGGKWTAMAPPPFAEPLFRPAVVPTGDRLIVVGAPCRDASTIEGEGEPLCTTKVDFVAASYDPSADHWALLRPSDLLTTARGDVGASAIGWTAPRAVFGVVFKRPGYVAYNAEAKDWERIAAPEDIPDICTTSDAILAIAQPDLSPRTDIDYGMTDVATFRYRDGTWARVAREPRPTADQGTSDTRCSGGVVVYVSRNKTGRVAAISMFSSDREGWRQLPTLEVPLGSLIHGSALGDGTQLLASYGGSGPQRVFSRSAEAAKWREQEVPEYPYARIVAGYDDFLLVPGEPLKDGLFIGTV